MIKRSQKSFSSIVEVESTKGKVKSTFEQIPSQFVCDILQDGPRDTATLVSGIPIDVDPLLQDNYVPNKTGKALNSTRKQLCILKILSHGKLSGFLFCNEETFSLSCSQIQPP